MVRRPVLVVVLAVVVIMTDRPRRRTQHHPDVCKKRKNWQRFSLFATSSCIFLPGVFFQTDGWVWMGILRLLQDEPPCLFVRTFAKNSKMDPGRPRRSFGEYFFSLLARTHRSIFFISLSVLSVWVYGTAQAETMQ